MSQQVAVSMDGYFPGGAEGSQNTKEVERLRKSHILHTKYAPLWDFYLSAYEGGTDFANGKNLFRHIRENEKDYDDRVVRLHNLNYCESLVDFFTNFIFSEVIERNGGGNADLYREFLTDVDRRKSTIESFMRQVCEDMQIFGMVYGLVDTPVIDQSEGIVTKYDEMTQGIRPYWCLVKPDEVIDWVTDELCVYQYLKRKQLTQELLGGSYTNIERYTEFYIDRIVVTKLQVASGGKAIVISQLTFPNALNKIPVVAIRYKASKRDAAIGLSFLRDFAGNNREIMNLTSLLQEFLYRQAFNILAREVDSAIPLRDQEEGVIGTSNVMEVPKGAKMPEYISPPADPAKFIQDERTRIKNEMFSRAAQDAMQELFNGEGKSGFSQAQSFAKTMPFISSRADKLEEFEVEMMQLTMELIGKNWDGKIKYKDRYEMTNLTDCLSQLKLLVRDFQLPSETFVKEELKRAMREFDGKLPPETIAIIEKEIDDMDWNDWLETQQIALIGRADMSPAAEGLLERSSGVSATPAPAAPMSEVAQESNNQTRSTKQPKSKNASKKK